MTIDEGDLVRLTRRAHRQLGIVALTSESLGLQPLRLVTQSDRVLKLLTLTATALRRPGVGSEILIGGIRWTAPRGWPMTEVLASHVSQREPRTYGRHHDRVGELLGWSSDSHAADAWVGL